MHRARVLTAVFLLPLVVLLILKGPESLLLVVVILLASLGFHEYARMTALPQGLFGLGLFSLWFLAGGLFLKGLSWSAGLWTGLFLSTLYFLKNFDKASFLRLWALTLAGLLYIALGFFHLFALTELSKGRLWLLTLLAAVFGTDTGAYYVGKALGRHKLAPHISPGKTVEGAIGGTLLGTGLGTGLGLYFGLAGSKWLLMVSLFVSIVGQIGDLLESMIKRACGVKDSGALLPGHGGILDRVDALIFAAPLLYWFLVIFQKLM